MPLPDPKLDDRRFQDIVDQAKSLIPRYTPEWTDHNVSDPGITLIELFAWMTDLTLYRLNRVPEKTYLRFMDLLGVSLKPPVPARTRIALWLSAPQPGPITIARGTEVATVRTGDLEATSFATDDELVLVPPTLRHLLYSADAEAFTDRSERIDTRGDRYDAFQDPPIPGEALYLGFDENLSNHILRLTIDCDVEGIGIDPRDPPLLWEAWCGDASGWLPIHVERDETGGLNRPGDVWLHLPEHLEQATFGRRSGYWVRVRVIQPRANQPMYAASPSVGSIAAATLGGEAWATHSTTIISELLERATGLPGQTFQLEYTPVLPRRDDEYLEVQDPDTGEWERWHEVATFADTGPDDRCYTLDGVTGIISLAPTIREPDGTERAHGATPKRGAAVRFTRYRQGGGIEGNVGANTLTVLKSSIPYVARVTNIRPATGGLNAESLEAAKRRVPSMLKSRDRAVTAEDFEFLAGEASPQVARAKCIQTRTDGSSSVPPGTIELLIVPVLPTERERTPDTLQPSPELLERVREYLDERRLLGTQLVVDGPAYVGVSVEARLYVQPHRDPEQVRQQVADRLTRYFDPLLGGPDGAGWPFGRPVHLSEVQSVILSVPGVEFAQDVTLYQIDTLSGETRAAGQQITIADDVLLLPYEHTITVAGR